MTEEEKKELSVMLGAAKIYNDSGVLLEDIICKILAPLVREKGAELGGSIIGSVILYALSCEIGLKSLYIKNGLQIPKKHDLKSLFEGLPEEVQNEIKTGLQDDNLNKEFDTLLVTNKDAFINWRYYYEGNQTVNIYFLRKLASSIFLVGKKGIE